MSTSPSDTERADEVATEEAAEEGPLDRFAADVAEAVGGTGSAAFDTVKVSVDAASWTEAVATVRDRFGLVFFSWLSAIHWANEVAVGDPLTNETDDRYEVLCTLSDLSEGRRVTLSTDIDAHDPRLPSLVSIFPGADWHEREAHDMFGIVFEGHPGLHPLYLPDGFIGHPLRKSFPLLSREVKPWPGKVDVEPMPEGGDDSDEDAGPSTENPEA